MTYLTLFKTKLEKATFAAGCFWGIEAAFKQVKGVVKTTVGYTGGSFENPTYEDVCNGKTGHAEAVEVEFDPKKTSYQKLLEVFWRIHDPTQINRQGPDVGSQYRSVIFYHDSNQKKLSETSMKKGQKIHAKPITTKIVKVPKFWLAEDYHQDYHEKHGGTCKI
ncbi:MAG TPA: peptide-methionine (S)-S-oxide reductase MsrA [Candidatus Aenigmarchaeota archaeon]|nr:peptide-methionine (S)-S-oxide reductase MsrA [Candidatus Aenigmarchaeota archaeon]